MPLGALIGLGSAYLGYRGAQNQARAINQANAANVEEQRKQREFYEKTIGPGIDYARTAFQSGIPSRYIQPQYDAAGYSAGLGRYYGAQAIPEYERGRRLEDLGTQEAVSRLGTTPEQLAAEQVTLGSSFANPYQQQVTNQGLAAIQGDYNQRAQQAATQSARSGILGSTIAGQRQAAIEGARAGAIGDFQARESAKAYNLGLDRALGAQNRAADRRGAAAQALAQQGAAVTSRGTDLADRAVRAGETSARLGVDASFAPARSYLSTVQSPVSARPTVTTPQPSNINPLAYGAGIGLQTYYDLQRHRG